MPQKPPGSNITRWLSIVALGCLLSLIFIAVVFYTLPVQQQVFGRIIIGTPIQREFSPTNVKLQSELQTVINSQLSAFRQNDYSVAYSYAAADIKANLPLPSFEKMVKASFPLIAQSRSANFGTTIDDGAMALVNVTIIGDSGETRHYQYFLQREKIGWKICGVKEVRPPGTLI